MNTPQSIEVPGVMPPEDTQQPAPIVARVYVHSFSFDAPGIRYNRQRRTHAEYSRCVNYLSEHKQRNRAICDQAISDLEKGYSIIIPVLRLSQVEVLVSMINETYGSEVAGGLIGGDGSFATKAAARASILSKVCDGTLRVVVGIRTIVQTLERSSCFNMLYNVMPTSSLSKWHLEISNILNVNDARPKPVIRLFVDSHVGVSLGCFIRTYNNTMKLGHKPTEEAKFHFKECIGSYTNLLRQA